MTGAALVTGGARRLGRAMVEALAARGDAVAIHYAGSRAEAETLAQELRSRGGIAETLQADLLDDEAVFALVPEATEKLGRPLTALINNASIFEYDRLETATPESWDRHMSSNLKAPLFLMQAFANQCPKDIRDARGERIAGGCIINMVDMRVRKPTPEFTTYSLAKAGLWTLTRTAAQGLAPNVRVNAIGPGPTLKGSRQSDKHFAGQRSNTILERGSNPADIVATMLYLLDNPAVTGQLICVDGGQHLAWQTPDVQGIE
ncbi:SDR family oxidoreductase [Algicella marina]|uniref:SDR family oxidoreductase n=1 Tax=Algicella marina TaxID=2683284 RepID=A0A6P1T2B7_9RHOB|nr:SDR family oxidoreductase [Algicella marina]QHQ35940.1 SDR family oxidoreductase [Algicella marina]